MKLIDLLIEERKYEYGCVMLYFTFPEINKIQDIIKPEHLYEEEDDDSYGFEDGPHVSLLFGLHSDVTDKQVEKVLDKYTYYTVKLYNPSIFKNDDYDVLKFDVEGDNLHETNKDLSKLPHTTDFPDYKPHMTIAYLKSGYGSKYIPKIKKFGNFWVAPQYAIYSKTDETKTKISINID